MFEQACVLHFRAWPAFDPEVSRPAFDPTALQASVGSFSSKADGPSLCACVLSVAGAINVVGFDEDRPVLSERERGATGFVD